MKFLQKKSLPLYHFMCIFFMRNLFIQVSNKAHPNLNQNDADIETPNKLQGRPRKQIEARKELKKGGK